MRRLPAFAVLSLALLAPSAAQAKTVTVTKTAKNTTVKLEKGDVLRVKLAENASTGYGWRRAVKPSSVLSYRGSRYVSPRQSDPQIVGAPGTRYFRFGAARRGTTSFTLGLYPPGRGGKAAEKVKLKVAVS
ncbi:MAG TPA: protease inhibitor I42 family protein [Thermoleophilaceae bacterium]|nr:protease inhibitor I42 family protein [Thermoleophilaceae bacterium]